MSTLKDNNKTTTMNRKSAKEMIMENLKNNMADRIAGESVAKEYFETHVNSPIHQDDKVVSILVDQITPNPYQPRRKFEQQYINDLAESIKSQGLLQPIIVRVGEGGYQICAGERRWRATKQLGLKTIDAIVKTMDDEDMAVMALVENIERQDLSDYEIGMSLAELSKNFPSKQKIADFLKLPRMEVYRYLAFNELPAWILNRLEIDPGLISRLSAFELKTRIFNTPNYTEEAYKKHIEKALDLIEKKELTQALLVPRIQKLLSEEKNQKTTTDYTNKKYYEINGKKVGKFISNEKSLTIKINSDVLPEEAIDKIHTFIASQIKN